MWQCHVIEATAYDGADTYHIADNIYATYPSRRGLSIIGLLEVPNPEL